MREDPAQLVVEYQGTIDTIVGKFVRSGMFAPGQSDDVVQMVSEGVLKRLESIRSHFNGSTLVRTYLSVIIRNICLEIRRTTAPRQQAEISVPDQRSFAASPVDDPSSQVIIAEEVLTFNAILIQFGRNLPKLLLMLKLRFHLLITTADILKWDPDCRRTDLDYLMNLFGKNYDAMPDQDIYRAITPVMNEGEGKQNTSDALRKWTSSRINEILELLNGSPPIGAHTEETLKILVEDHFSPFLIRE